MRTRIAGLVVSGFLAACGSRERLPGSPSQFARDTWPTSFSSAHVANQCPSGLDGTWSFQTELGERTVTFARGPSGEYTATLSTDPERPLIVDGVVRLYDTRTSYAFCASETLTVVSADGHHATTMSFNVSSVDNVKLLTRTQLFGENETVIQQNTHTYALTRRPR